MKYKKFFVIVYFNTFFNFKVFLIICKFFFFLSSVDIKHIFSNFIFSSFLDFLLFKFFFPLFKFTYFEYKIFNLFLPIYYENNLFLVLNKPFNFVVHDSINFLSYNLINSFLNYYGKKSFSLLRSGFLNRLDKNTTGILIIFKKLFFYIDYLIQFLTKITNNCYVIYLFGRFSIRSLKLNVFNNLKSLILDFKKNSFFKFLSFKSFKFYNYFLTFLKCSLKSGRMHQIRIIFNYIKKYIICDNIYNNFEKYFFLYYLSRTSIHLFFLKIFFYNFNYSFSLPLYKDMLNFFYFLNMFNS